VDVLFFETGFKQIRFENREMFFAENDLPCREKRCSLDLSSRSLGSGIEKPDLFHLIVFNYDPNGLLMTRHKNVQYLTSNGKLPLYAHSGNTQISVCCQLFFDQCKIQGVISVELQCLRSDGAWIG
jgi:hypothetical protein